MSGNSPQWYAVFESGSGELVSTGTEVARPLPAGLAVSEIAGPPRPGERWDSATRAFVLRHDGTLTSVGATPDEEQREPAAPEGSVPVTPDDATLPSHPC